MRKSNLNDKKKNLERRSSKSRKFEFHVVEHF